MLPVKGESFDEIIFVELEEKEAQALVVKYNADAKALLPPQEKRFRGNQSHRFTAIALLGPI